MFYGNRDLGVYGSNHGDKNGGDDRSDDDFGLMAIVIVVLVITVIMTCCYDGYGGDCGDADGDDNDVGDGGVTSRFTKSNVYPTIQSSFDVRTFVL